MMHRRNHWIPVLVVGLIVGGVLWGPAAWEQIARAVQARTRSQQLAELSRGDRLSPLFQAVAQAVKPSVVVVRVTQKFALAGAEPEDESAGPGFVPRPGTPEAADRYRYARGQGSGVIVDAEKGYILTNHHVVWNADSVEIILPDGRVFQTEWIRSDRKTDIAVLKIQADHLREAPLGDSDTVQTGQWVLAVGAPLGLPQTVTAGIVSGTGRSTGDGLMLQDFIQTDAAINRGNSGGPLVNTRGEVVGINTAILSNTGMNVGVGMAVPSNMARHVMDQLIAHGEVVRGFLGVSYQEIDPPLARSFSLPHNRGTLVTGVLPDSPAERAGIKPEDFIVAVGGQDIRSGNVLRNVVAMIAPGQAVRVTLYRDGQRREVELLVGTMPSPPKVRPEQPATGRTSGLYDVCGLVVQTLTADRARKYGYPRETRGVLVAGVDRGGQGWEDGLRAGMVITHVGDQAIADGASYARQLAAHAEARGVRMRFITPTGVRRYVYLPIDEPGAD